MKNYFFKKHAPAWQNISCHLMPGWGGTNRFCCFLGGGGDLPNHNPHTPYIFLLVFFFPPGTPWADFFFPGFYLFFVFDVVIFFSGWRPKKLPRHAGGGGDRLGPDLTLGTAHGGEKKRGGARLEGINKIRR